METRVGTRNCLILRYLKLKHVTEPGDDLEDFPNPEQTSDLDFRRDRQGTAAPPCARPPRYSYTTMSPILIEVCVDSVESALAFV